MSNILHEYDETLDDTVTWGICDANIIKTSFYDPSYTLLKITSDNLLNNPLT